MVRDKRILVVDDDKNILKVIEMYLLKEGYSKTTVDDELQAYFSTNKEPVMGIFPKKEFADNFQEFVKTIRR